MISKEQAIKLGDGTLRGDIHCEFGGPCRRDIGPRGGTKDSVAAVRPSGRCQTWKTRPNEFRLPVKFGLYQSGEITHGNMEFFHLASECPIDRDPARTYYKDERPSERAMRLAAHDWEKREGQNVKS